MKLTYPINLLTILFFCTIVLVSYSCSIGQALNWALGFGAFGDDRGTGIKIDSYGNIYTVGFFGGTIDFDPGTDTVQLSSQGQKDIFIQKLDSVGNLVWVKRIGAAGYDLAFALDLDQLNNVIVSGVFENSVDFNPGTDSNVLSSNGKRDIFILKLDTDGKFLWAKSMGGIGFDAATSLHTDNFGNVYTTGTFDDVVDFDPGPDSIMISVKGSRDVFIQKLDKEGNLAWVKSLESNKDASGTSLFVDSLQQIYVSGFFNDSIDLDPGPSTDNYIGEGRFEIFTLKLDSMGQYIWGKVNTSSSFEFSNSIMGDKLGNIYTTGYFHDSLDIDPGPAINYLYAKFSRDIYLQKLDSNGNFLWGKSFPGIGFDEGRSIQLDHAGNVYVAGLFSDTLEVENNGRVTLLNSNGLTDVFIVKLSPNGDLIWANSIGGNSSEEVFDLTITKQGVMAMTGFFSGTVDFDPGSGIFNLNSAGGEDIFILHLNHANTVSINRGIVSSLKIYPNPAPGTFTIDLSTEETFRELEILDFHGKRIFYKKKFKSGSPIHLPEVNPGIYFLRLSQSDSRQYIGRIIIE